MRLLDAYHEAPIAKSGSTDLLALGLSVQESFNKLQKQAERAAQLFGNHSVLRFKSNHLIYTDPLAQASLDCKFRFVNYLGNRLFGKDGKEFMPPPKVSGSLIIQKSLVQWIVRMLLRLTNRHFCGSLGRFVSHWSSLLNRFSSKFESVSPDAFANYLLKRYKDGAIFGDDPTLLTVLLENHAYQKEREAAELLAAFESKDHRLACAKRSRELKKAVKQSGGHAAQLGQAISLCCYLFGGYYPNLCDEGALQLLFPLFLEREVFAGYLRRTIIVGPAEAKCRRMAHLLAEFKVVSSRAHRWCLPVPEGEEAGAEDEDECEIASILRVGPLLEEMKAFFLLCSEFSQDSC